MKISIAGDTYFIDPAGLRQAIEEGVYRQLEHNAQARSRPVKMLLFALVQQGGQELQEKGYALPEITGDLLRYACALAAIKIVHELDHNWLVEVTDRDEHPYLTAIAEEPVPAPDDAE